MQKGFRQDIAGLRAVAVLAVTLFHITYVFKPEGFGFSGGFLGVDIFFVISGYLMTMIIITGISNGNFSLWTFYKNRAKRICPALLIVVLITMMVSSMLLNIVPFRASAREALVSLAFISNFRFARNVDYFDGGDLSHLFLHTWSLSVEWQFYLFYPLILIAINKFIDRQYIARILLCLAIASFIVAIIWTDINARQSYFLLPSRACELLVGSLAYFYPLSNILNLILLKLNNSQNNKLGGGKSSVLYEAIGLTIIVISLMIIDDKSGWPTAWIALPMFGTYLCIAACNQRSLLRGAFFQKIGQWSYSIYLVHWPIVVFAANMGLAGYSFIWLLPIFICGYLLHILIERRRDYTKKFTVLYFCSAALLYFSDANDLIKYVRQSSFQGYEIFGGASILEAQTTVIGNSNPKLILAGDSLSREYGNALIQRDIDAVINNKDGCYSLGNHFAYLTDSVARKNVNDKCFILYEKTKLLAAQYPFVPIVFITNWPSPGDKAMTVIDETIYAKSEAERYSDAVSKAVFADIVQVSEDFKDRDIYFVGKKQVNQYFSSGQAVNFSFISPSVARYLNIAKKDDQQVDFVDKAINDVIKAAIDYVQARRRDGENLAHVQYIDPNVYCNAGSCKLFLDDYVPIYSDELHYSWAGSHKPLTHILQSIGVDPKDEPKDLRVAPEIDFDKHQLVLEYSPESGFKFPE